MSILDQMANAMTNWAKSAHEEGLVLLEKDEISDEDFSFFINNEVGVDSRPFELPPSMHESELKNWSEGINLPDQTRRFSFVRQVVDLCHPSLY